MKFIFVTWWVISWIGKWIAAASLGKLLVSAWYKVNAVKLDPYLQTDAGTMSPYEHGETFVTADWFETDLDLWHYERFLNVNITRNSSVTSGRIFSDIIAREREWKYLGKTVQVVPHVTNYIKEIVKDAAMWYDVTLVEVWWTIWDIEWPHFIEAIRQMRKDFGVENTLYLHVVPLLYLKLTDELKTKPIQHSVKELTRLWIQPDLILCRTEKPIPHEIKEKIALFCDIDVDSVVEWIDVATIYDVVNKMAEQWVTQVIEKKLALPPLQPNLTKRNELLYRITAPKHTVHIAIAGKYAEMPDAYLSVIEACKHAGAYCDTKVCIHRFLAEEITSIEQIKNFVEEQHIDAFIVPGGFGYRGVEWKILVAERCRTTQTPYLGLCLWLQIAVIEFARNVCGLAKANSLEFDTHTSDPIIAFMAWQSEELAKWWTMRLWNYTAQMLPGCVITNIYQQVASHRCHREERTTFITERHRHRYEVNPMYVDLLKHCGLVISGTDTQTHLVEYIEHGNHPYFVATQAHPEFTSRLEDPHPLFVGLVQAAMRR